MGNAFKLDLRGGTVEVTGMANNQPVVVTGNIDDMRIEVVSTDDPNVFKFLAHQQYYLKFRPKSDGSQYNIKLGGIAVTKEATIEASDQTVAAFEKARERVGAPENAKVSVGPSWSNRELALEDLDTPHPITVRFRWTETVYL